MKKGRQAAPLFRSEEPAYYLVDTSAWINLDEREDRIDAWSYVCWFIEQGRVITCMPVFRELEKNDLLVTYLRPRKKHLLKWDRDDNDYLRCVGRITRMHPAMCKARSAKEPADPYVLALAKLDEYVLVCDESKKNPGRKLSGVCDGHGVTCISSAEFLRIAKSEHGS